MDIQQRKAELLQRQAELKALCQRAQDSLNQAMPEMYRIEGALAIIAEFEAAQRVMPNTEVA